MFTSIYTALSGLLGFSRGLDVVSNNVANLNTPGFKRSELTFRDLFYRFSQEGGAEDGRSGQIGVGTSPGDTRLRFRAGELRETGNPLDVAIDGNGFFVLRRDGTQVYTRAGQFEFDTAGVLTERGSGGKVMSLKGGQLEEISIEGLRTVPAKPTGEVRIGGNLSTGSTSADLTGITVFDAAGREQTLSLRATRDANDPTSWVIEIRDATSSVLGGGTLRFQGNGSPAPGFNTVSIVYAPGQAPANTIVFNFGEPGSFSGTTNFSGGADSTLQVQRQDGFGPGSLTRTTFDQHGVLQLTYSNGQTASGAQLALAWFDNLQALVQLGEGLFAADASEPPRLDVPGQGVMGSVVAERIELSNVELAEEFTELIILQRGYQASSQVTSVANEMIQQLLDVNRPR